MTKIAIIGAGLAGVSLGRLLASQHDVTIFEKARGMGGRMATRYTPSFEFDHGAQFFTVRDPAFQDFLAPYMLEQIVEPWSPRCVHWDGDSQDLTPTDARDIFVASPRMNNLVKAIATPLPVHRSTHIQHLEKTPQGWMIHDLDNYRYGPFDWVISTAPAPQSFALMPKAFIHHYRHLNANLRGCFTLMLGYHTPFETDFDFAKADNSVISSLCINNSKPKRSQENTCIVIQSNNQWADENINHDPHDMVAPLLAEAEEMLERPLGQFDFHAAHKWRYALCDRPLKAGFLMDQHQKLALCGEWCQGGRVEDAFLSAHHLAHSLREIL